MEVNRDVSRNFVSFRSSYRKVNTYIALSNRMSRFRNVRHVDNVIIFQHQHQRWLGINIRENHESNESNERERERERNDERLVVIEALLAKRITHTHRRKIINCRSNCRLASHKRTFLFALCYIITMYTFEHATHLYTPV